MKSTKSTKSTTKSSSKSMKSKLSSGLKKYSAGAVVTDDKDKGKGKSAATKYMNRMDKGLDDLGNKIKSFIPTGVKNYGKSVVKDVKDTYKKVEGAALDKLDRICNPNTDVCPYKKGGVVGKSRRK